jgi:simple sugar transport system substrate-binding protein
VAHRGEQRSGRPLRTSRRAFPLRLLATLVCIASTLLSASTASAAQVLDTTIRMAFVYSGSPREGSGSTYQHDLGRQAVEKAFGRRVIVTVKENIEVADIDTVIRNLVREGNSFIISTSPDFADAALRAAALFPKVQFEQVASTRSAANLAAYQVRLYEGAYLMGIIAGGMTKSKILGFVAPKPTPEVIRNINAFTLGARAVKPGTTTKVRWVGTANDPAKERDLAEDLVNAGADVLTQNTESSAVMNVAEKRKVRALGWNAELIDAGRNAQLTANLANWAPYYINTTRNALNGIWSGGRITRIGIREGAVTLTAINPDVPANVIAFAESRRQLIAADRFDPFRGPLTDNEGRQRFKAGIAMLEDELAGFDWFVEGVADSIPQPE